MGSSYFFLPRLPVWTMMLPTYPEMPTAHAPAMYATGRTDMRYLVTGGTGFIGAYAVRALLEAGHQVAVLDLMPNREFLADVLGAPPGQDMRVVSGDVTDMPLILRTMHEAQAERVVHLAATLSISSEANPLRTLKVNCEGTINVFEAALALGVSKVVWASSVAVFGGAEQSEERI